jgi:hypothetical protein
MFITTRFTEMFITTRFTGMCITTRFTGIFMTTRFTGIVNKGTDYYIQKLMCRINMGIYDNSH